MPVGEQGSWLDCYSVPTLKINSSTKQRHSPQVFSGGCNRVGVRLRVTELAEYLWFFSPFQGHPRVKIGLSVSAGDYDSLDRR